MITTSKGSKSRKQRQEYSHLSSFDEFPEELYSLGDGVTENNLCCHPVLHLLKVSQE